MAGFQVTIHGRFWVTAEGSSMQTIKMSFTPRFFSSVSTPSQKFAPSVCFASAETGGIG